MPPPSAHAPTVPGALVRVWDVGILLQGDSGSGKSELALGLLDRGHQLVADDAVELAHEPDGLLIGRCPQALRGLLEVRGLGLVRVAQLYGAAALADQAAISLVILLERPAGEDWRRWPRLEGLWDETTLLGVSRPRLRFPVAPGRPLPLLLETTVHYWLHGHREYHRGVQPDA